MNWKKIGLTIGVCALLLVVGCYGIYQYVVHRYAAQIDDIVAGLIEGSGSPETTPNPVVIEPPAGQTPPPATGTTPPSVMPPIDKPSETETKPPSNPSQTGAVAQAAEGLKLTEQEQTKAESATDLLEQMSTAEKLMVLKTLNHFSPAELLEMYRIYSSGDAEAIANIKEEIKAKFSEADIEMIKQMAAKYR